MRIKNAILKTQIKNANLKCDFKMRKFQSNFLLIFHQIIPQILQHFLVENSSQFLAH